MAPVDPDTDPVLDPDPILVQAWGRLVRPFAELRSRWTALSGELGISPAAVSALVSVNPSDPQPMRELAALLDCDASYITGLVDDLERAGYAHRQPSATDRRVKVVALTADGERARGVAQQALTAPPPELLALPLADRQTLAAILHRASSTKIK